jgi:hypothetical protein
MSKKHSFTEYDDKLIKNIQYKLIEDMEKSLTLIRRSTD